MPTESPKFNSFDFWLCVVLEIAGAIGLFIELPMPALPTAFLVRVGIGHAFYILLTAGIVGWLSVSSGVVVFPIFEDWWRGRLVVKRAAARLVGAAGIGVANCYLARYYGAALRNWNSGPLPKRLVRPDVLGVVASTILEEILFRAIIFVGLVALIRWPSRFWASRAQSGIFWVGNFLQALIFGAAHVALGRGIPYGRPWYIRVPVTPQTWGGLVLGWIFWKYGLESAIVCHATYDLSLRALRLLKI